ncbi:MAG TPA: hypothetical protein VK476_00520, partial [Flavobacterium sp.]|nr:hypothetical protein [Flavobacterium sp.]
MKIRQSELETIIAEIDEHYREKIEIKCDKLGSPKLDKYGRPQQRVLYPSKKRLKQIQRLILKNVLAEIKLPEYAFGSIKGKDNVRNARKHVGKKFIFTTDLK